MMRVKLREAADGDVPGISALCTEAAETLTRRFGAGHWSGIATEKGVRFGMRTSKVFMAHHRRKLVATLRLSTKKPWAIDRSHFSASKRPLYLLSMAVAPDLQRRGVGRPCIEQVKEVCRLWLADAVRLDSYNAPAGAGRFYAKCGFRNVGGVNFRGCPLSYFEWVVQLSC
jgi:GNAT superfamily N-acetyltransferase